MDDKLKELMLKLGDEINAAISDSEGIDEVIGEIKATGYDIFLVLEVTVGFNKRRGGEETEENQEQARISTQVKITAEDQDLLKKMHIIMPEDDDPNGSAKKKSK